MTLQPSNTATRDISREILAPGGKCNHVYIRSDHNNLKLPMSQLPPMVEWVCELCCMHTMESNAAVSVNNLLPHRSTSQCLQKQVTGTV